MKIFDSLEKGKAQRYLNFKKNHNILHESYIHEYKRSFYPPTNDDRINDDDLHRQEKSRENKTFLYEFFKYYFRTPPNLHLSILL